DPTRLTAAITGKPVRAFSNRLITEMEKGGFTLPYPYQGSLSADIRQAALRQERPELAAMLAGQGAPLAVDKPAGQLFRDLVTQAEQVAARLSVGPSKTS
ncbi:MAG TPA: nitronate monooxygenase, partial [Myxococcaceae bacterium]|nr:nitronate monooxygenase [Myxococcaceae bacterium]